MPKRKPKEYNAGKLMQEMELELIASMKRNFERHERWEKSEGFEWEQWQSAKLRDLKRYQVANRKIVGRYSKPMTEYVKDHIRNQFLEGGRKVDTEVESILEKGKSMIKGTPSLDFFTGNNKKLGKLINAVTGDLSTAHTAVLRHMDDVYRKTIFKATLFGSSGAVTVDKAIDMATKEFLEKGINCIRYADGKRVNIASYTGMAVRTASKRAYLTGEGERRKEWGVSTVRISAYTGCSNLCKPWQGRIYIDDVWSGGTAADGDYPLLSVAIQGKLFHPNCKHTSSTYFPEVDEDYVVIKGDETAEYSTIQRQNEINRNIQKYERLKTGSLDSQNIKKYGDKVNELQERKFEILEGQQEYKPVKIDTTKSFSRNRRNRVINAYKLVGIKNDIYLSKKAKLKPKQLNNIDNSITKAYELIENRDGYIKPIIVITEYAELDGAMASYSAINNVMYINSELGTISKLLDIQKGLACPENKLSTYYHEFLHWKDAQDYISKKGAINNQRDYLKWCVIQSKKEVVKFIHNGYNISEISDYAYDNFKRERYDEVYTEFRVKKELG